MRSAIRLLLLAFGLILTGSVYAEDPVVVTLRPSVSVSASPVCVGQVATLRGGGAMLRAKIEALDLADRPKRGRTQPLARELIAYRIQVAGIDPSRFRVEGAPVVEISPAASLTDDDFVEAARDALLDRFPGRASDLVVTLAQALGIQPPALTSHDEVRLDAQPREPSNLPGRCRVDVTVFVNGERLGLVPVLVDVQVFQAVAVAARRIEGGEALNEENVRFERHAVDSLGSCLTARDIAGRKTRRALMPGQVIPQAAVETQAADSPILVKPRDLVKIVARLGGLSVTALGEAQQEGREGDRIRVRNVDSKKEVVGRVIGRGLVDVDFQ